MDGNLSSGLPQLKPGISAGLIRDSSKKTQSRKRLRERGAEPFFFTHFFLSQTLTHSSLSPFCKTRQSQRAGVVEEEEEEEEEKRILENEREEPLQN